MGKKFFAVALLVTSLVACKSKTAVDFNNKLVAIENSLIGPMTGDEKKASEYYKAGNYDSVIVIGGRLENLLQSKIDEIESIKAPDVEQAENFKTSYLKAFKALKEVYTIFKKLGSAKTDEERQMLTESMQTMFEEKEQATKDMQAAQRIFASANGIKLQ